MFYLIIDFQHPLHGFRALVRMDTGDAGMACGQMFLYLGAVFHGTGPFTDAQGHIGAQGFLREVIIVAVDPHLVYFRQGRRFFPPQPLRDGRDSVPYLADHILAGHGNQHPPLAWYAHFKDDRFIPSCLMVIISKQFFLSCHYISVLS